MNIKVQYQFAQNKQYHYLTEYHCKKKNETIDNFLHFLFGKIKTGDWVFRVGNLKTNQSVNLRNYKESTLEQFQTAFCEGSKIEIICVKKEHHNQYCPNTIKKMNEKIKECKEIMQKDINDMTDWVNIHENKKQKMQECFNIITNCECNICCYYNFINPNRWKHLNIARWYHDLLSYYSKDQNERRIHIIHTLQNCFHNADLGHLKLHMTEWPTFFNKTCHYVYQGWFLMSSQSIKNYIHNFDIKLKRLNRRWTPADLSLLYKSFHFVIPDSPKKKFVTEFWTYFLCIHGDWAPNLLRVAVPVQRRIDIFKNDFIAYCDEFGWDNNCDYVSYPYFMHVLYELQTVYRIRFTDKRRFTMCKQCSDILKASLNCNSLLEHEKIHLLKLAHLEQIRLVRHQILVYEMESKQCPGKSAVIIADSMDQSCLNLPFDQRMSKSNASRAVDSTCKFWLTCFISTMKPKYTFFLKNAQTGKQHNLFFVFFFFGNTCIGYSFCCYI